MQVTGTQQFPAPSPKLHPELCGPRRTGNQTRGDTEAAEAGSGRGCPRASPRGPLGSPEDSHGCDFSDRPSGMSQSVMRIRVPESPREGLPPLRPSASLFLANQSHAASGCQATPTWPWQVTPRLRRDSAPPPDPGPQPQLRFRISPEPCPCGDPASPHPREPGRVTQERSSVLPWVGGGGQGAFHTHTPCPQPAWEPEDCHTPREGRELAPGPPAGYEEQRTWVVILPALRWKTHGPVFWAMQSLPKMSGKGTSCLSPL